MRAHKTTACHEDKEGFCRKFSFGMHLEYDLPLR